MHKLEAQGLKKIIKKTTIVSDVSLYVNSGEVVGLLGPNGAGKTTSFYMICGLIEASEGDIFFDGENISSLPLHARARKGIGYLPQESSIFKDLSVEENLMLAAEIVYDEQHIRDEKVEHLLELLNIEPIRNRQGISLSGGERRRCEIARALMLYPDFLLLDEPFAGVDPIAVHDIQNIINELKNLGIGVLITDHNVRETLDICDRAYVMNRGEILASGTSEEVYANPLVIKHYLGENFSI